MEKINYKKLIPNYIFLASISEICYTENEVTYMLNEIPKIHAINFFYRMQRKKVFVFPQTSFALLTNSSFPVKAACLIRSRAHCVHPHPQTELLSSGWDQSVWHRCGHHIFHRADRCRSSSSPLLHGQHCAVH